jgi:hypothetical protein
MSKAFGRMFVFSFLYIFTFTQSANADESWFAPKWDANVLSSKVLTVIAPVFGNSMLIGVPTEMMLDKNGCANVIYHLAPLNALSQSSDSRGPATDYLKKFARFEVAVWTSDGQNLGSLVKEGQNGDFAPTNVTLASQTICISNPSPGSKTEVLLQMKAGVRITGSGEIRTLDNLTIRLNAPATAKASKTTINCVKGKLTKKITGINPKCPAGYTKK